MRKTQQFKSPTKRFESPYLPNNQTFQPRKDDNHKHKPDPLFSKRHWDTLFNLIDDSKGLIDFKTKLIKMFIADNHTFNKLCVCCHKNPKSIDPIDDGLCEACYAEWRSEEKYHNNQ